MICPFCTFLHETESDVADDIFADYGLSAAWLHQSCKLVEVRVKLVNARVWPMEKGDFRLRCHNWTGQTFWSVGSSVYVRRVCGPHPHSVLDTLRKSSEFPPHVDKEASPQSASRVRLQLSGFGTIRQVHPVLYEVCKAVVTQNQRLAVAPSGQ